MDLGLTSKIAVVTARQQASAWPSLRPFAAEGAEVIVNGRTEARVTAAVDHIRQTVRNAQVGEWRPMLEQSPGRVDVEPGAPSRFLVNNVGII